METILTKNVALSCPANELFESDVIDKVQIPLNLSFFFFFFNFTFFFQASLQLLKFKVANKPLMIS